jgi:hypothetical protein
VFCCPLRHAVTIVLAGLSLACLLSAALLLRRVGPRYRIARQLAGAPAVSIDEAIELAGSGLERYVRVSGRVSSEEEFPDEHDRPLVYRRSRLEVADARGGWRAIAQDIEAVPFGVETRGSFLAVDAAALGNGLVVVPREAVGRVADLDAELAAGEDPDAASRLVIEQVSAIEQALVAGVPRLDDEGVPTIGAGLGRPLILSAVELPAAMRLLASGQRTTVVTAALLLMAAAAAGVDCSGAGCAAAPWVCTRAPSVGNARQATPGSPTPSYGLVGYAGSPDPGWLFGSSPSSTRRSQADRQYGVMLR